MKYHSVRISKVINTFVFMLIISLVFFGTLQFLEAGNYALELIFAFIIALLVLMFGAFRALLLVHRSVEIDGNIVIVRWFNIQVKKQSGNKIDLIYKNNGTGLFWLLDESSGWLERSAGGRVA